jgi:hypothetical protein
MQPMNRKLAGYVAGNAAAMWLASLIILVCAPIRPAAASGQYATPSDDSKAREKCGGIIDSRDWPNPFITIGAKSVVVAVHGSSIPRHEMPVDQLAAYLEQLPTSAWPCGKVVIAAEGGLRAFGDGPAIKENCSKVNEILKGLKVKVDWWPSA